MPLDIFALRELNYKLVASFELLTFTAVTPLRDTKSTTCSGERP